MTLPAHFWRRFPRRVVEVHGQEPWLPDETPFCTYSERHQIMRENYRYSMASLDALCKRIDETLYNSRANLLVFENETLEVSGDDDEL
jgi:hypothetical protein